MHYIFPYYHFYQPFFLGVGALMKSTGHTNSHLNTSAVQSTLWLCSDIPLHLLDQNYGGPDKTAVNISVISAERLVQMQSFTKRNDLD